MSSPVIPYEQTLVNSGEEELLVNIKGLQYLLHLCGTDNYLLWPAVQSGKKDDRKGEHRDKQKNRTKKW